MPTKKDCRIDVQIWADLVKSHNAALKAFKSQAKLADPGTDQKWRKITRENVKKEERVLARLTKGLVLAQERLDAAL